jgi:hypothetical protein
VLGTARLIYQPIIISVISIRVEDDIEKTSNPGHLLGGEGNPSTKRPTGCPVQQIGYP